MQLYLISQYENCDYETYKSAVVVAADADAARHLDPRTGFPMTAADWRDPYSHWASCPERVVVQHLGTAAENIHPGLILAHVRFH